MYHNRLVVNSPSLLTAALFFRLLGRNHGACFTTVSNAAEQYAMYEDYVMGVMWACEFEHCDGLQVTAQVAMLWKHLSHFQVDLQPPTPASALPHALTALTHLSLAPSQPLPDTMHASTAALSPCGAGAPPFPHNDKLTVIGVWGTRPDSWRSIERREV